MANIARVGPVSHDFEVDEVKSVHKKAGLCHPGTVQCTLEIELSNTRVRLR